jgi:hypothetical protein
MSKLKMRKVGRSAISGQFVANKYVKGHKPTTITQTVRVGKKPKKGH